jgi:hypothetical protein
LISGTLAAGASADGPYLVTATAAAGPSSSTQSFGWQVSSPVTLTSLGAQAITEGQAVSLQVQATAPGGDAVSYSATGLPAGLAIDPGTGLITGTPASGDARALPYVATVTAQAGAFSAAGVVSWQVSSPVTITGIELLVTLTGSSSPSRTDPATGTLATQHSTVGQAVSLQVLASDSTSGATLSYSASGLPLGLSINSTTGLISGTIAAGAAAVSPYQVTVTASDGSSGASVAFGWEVAGAVRLLNPGTQSTLVGQSGYLALQASAGRGVAVQYSATNLPPGLALDSSTGVISGTLADSDQGTYQVTVTASAGTYRDSATFAWQVTNPLQASAGSGQASAGGTTQRLAAQPDAPAAPTPNPITIANPGPVQEVAGRFFYLKLKTTDASGGTGLTYTADGLPPGLKIDKEGVIYGTLPANAAGLCEVTVTAKDGSASASTTFAVTVASPPLSPQERLKADIASLKTQLASSKQELTKLDKELAGLRKEERKRRTTRRGSVPGTNTVHSGISPPTNAGSGASTRWITRSPPCGARWRG